MQPINDPPRQFTLTSDITNLIENESAVVVNYGAIWLDRNLTPLSDLQQYMTPGSVVTRDISNTVQGGCTIYLASNAPINTLTDFVKPYITLSTPDGSKSAQFYLGVYTLETPQYDEGDTPAVLQYTGYDLLYYLNMPVGDSFIALAGTDPISAVTTIIGMGFPGANIISTDTTSVLAADMVWPFDSSDSSTTYLTIANALLAACGYHSLYCDWNGNFIVEPYVVPSLQPLEWTLDLTTSNNIVAEARTSTQDLFDVPNYWQFIMNNLSSAPVEGATQFTYEDYSANNAGSITNRGRILNKQIVYLDAANYASLYQQGITQIVADTSPAEVFTYSTFLLPLAWQEDQIFINDPNLAQYPPLFSPTRRVQSMSWSLPLDGSDDMSWTLQTVTQ